MKNKTLVRFCISAVIAALYAAVSLALAPLSFGPVQIRIAEAMTLLPVLFPEAIAGVTLGCFLTNLIGAIMGVVLGLVIPDFSVGQGMLVKAGRSSDLEVPQALRQRTAARFSADAGAVQRRDRGRGIGVCSLSNRFGYRLYDQCAGSRFWRADRLLRSGLAVSQSAG